MNLSLQTNLEKRAAALVIVLAFVVLLAAMTVAFLSRTTTDRQLAHGTYSESRADLLARSALDIVVADLMQEIVDGSTVSTISNHTIYTPLSAANMVPMRSGTPSPPAPLPDPVANLIRRSYNSGASPPDPIPAPGVSSRASAVNSTSVSLNGRSVTPARWNKHYLVGRLNVSSSAEDSTPVATFTGPDWVLVTRNGPGPSPVPFASWDPALKDATSTNGKYAVGRYAYAIYDEGGLLDMNVAGFPHATPAPTVTPAAPQPIYAPSPPYAHGSYPSGYTAASYTAQQVGRKGTPAFADLSSLPAATSTFFPATQINKLVGWRNYVSTQPGGDVSAGFTFDQAGVTNYFSSVRSSAANFLTISATPSPTPTRTDQAFVSRQELIALRKTIGFSQNLLQYFGTLSREYNRATWKPATPTAINPDLATFRVTTGFTRIDGTSAIAGEPLLKRRFPLSRLSWLTYKGPSSTRTIPPASPTPATTNPDYDMWQLVYAYGVSPTYLAQGTPENIKACFGLVWDSRAYVPGATPQVGQQWVYVSPSSANSGGTFNGTGGTTATVIKTLSIVQNEAREPDFFELLKAVILNGSVGLGSNGNTFVTANGKYYDTTNGKSADYQIMQIGGNVMDSWDTDNVPTFINFNSNEPTGVENLPYLNKLVFCPNFPPQNNGYFDAWLVPSLWNPHQNASNATGAVRIILSGSGTYIAVGVDQIGSTTITTISPPMAPLPASMDLPANGFGTPTPPSDPNPAPSAVTGAVTNVGPPEKYYGFHYPFDATTPFATQVEQQDADSAWPDFGAGGMSLELQVYIPGVASPVPYQTWNIAATSVPLKVQSAKGNFNKENGDVNFNSNKLQDPEFVALDPRTNRFGVWGTSASGQTTGNAKKDYYSGATDSLDQAAPANRIEQITLYSPQGAWFTVGSFPANLSLYATNGAASIYYTDLDGVQRAGDWTTTAPGTTKGATIMYASSKTTPPGGNIQDRPQILSAPFQSVAELGQVFRDQPWKTLNFTTTNSADAGLLDVFTLQDVPLTAGRTSLNTRQSPVLAAIMSQGGLRINGSSIITTSQANAVASAIVGITAANPLISKANLVAQLATNASFTGLGNKEARECVMRSLTDAGQTRTWNLMIDVIAQSGRYPPNATSLSQFVVEGEKRYWLHIAIDRFTGEVIDQQLEAVYE